MKKIYIGSDKLGVDMKSSIKSYLEENKIECVDVGCIEKDDETIYPLIAKKVCEEVLKNDDAKGILICGTGIGMCITANKFKGIYAAPAMNFYGAQRSVLSNNANVLCLGAQVTGIELAKTFVNEFVSLEYKDGRSTVKLEKIKEIEKENFK